MKNKKQLIKNQLEDIEIKQIEKTINLPNITNKKHVSFGEHKFFNEIATIRCIRNENIFENYIKINGENPIQFMNKFVNEMKNLFDGIMLSKIYLKFIITINKEENEEEENFKNENHNSLELGKNNEIEGDLNIIVELVKIRENSFLLNFTKGKGSIRDFFIYFKKIISYAEDLI